MWQDAIFLAGSVFSLFVLVPTLRDQTSSVPLGTSLPSATIGTVYGATFFTLGMHFSAVGSLATGIMWALVAALRSSQNVSAVVPFTVPELGDLLPRLPSSAEFRTQRVPVADIGDDVGRDGDGVAEVEEAE